MVKTAAMLAIGNELLTGKIRDANTHHVASQLREAGVALSLAMIVADEEEEIVAAIRYAGERADIIITTGGVGPTHDDITLRAVARAVGRPLVSEPSLVEAIHRHYGERVNDDVLSMARVPEGAELLQPAPFFLPVFRVENVYCFPGVPDALRLLFAPWKESIRQEPFHVVRLELDAEEGDLAPILSRVQAACPSVQLGSYPRYDADAPYRVLVTLDGRDSARVATAQDTLTDEIVKALGASALLRTTKAPTPGSEENDGH